jgi:hypothetical protein
VKKELCGLVAMLMALSAVPAMADDDSTPSPVNGSLNHLGDSLTIKGISHKAACEVKLDGGMSATLRFSVTDGAGNSYPDPAADHQNVVVTGKADFIEAIPDVATAFTVTVVSYVSGAAGTHLSCSGTATPTAITGTTIGDILYAPATGATANLPVGATDQCLKVASGLPAWGACTLQYLNGVDPNLPVHVEAFGPTTIQPSTIHMFTYRAPYTANPVCTVSSVNATPVLSLQMPPGTGQVIVQNYSGSQITQAELICTGN